MSVLLLALLWCIVQVTLVALLTWFLCVVTRRLSPQSSSPLPATALFAVIVLTALAFVPWPSSWSYGPAWNNIAATSPSEPLPSTPSDLPAAAPSQHVPDPQSPAPELPAAAKTSPSTEVPPEAAVDRRVTNDAARPTTAAENIAQIPVPAPQPSASAPATPWNWEALLLAILAIGVAVGLLQLLGGLVAAHAYRRKSCPIDDKALRELADTVCAELGCRRPVELRETSALASAATIGWRRPLVFLPLEWRDWTSEQLRAVLAHEIAHVARHDFLACVLAQASLALHFYHPLVHWLVHRLRLEQEVAADAAAAAIAGGRQVYLQILAELALRQSERPLGWPARTFLPTRGTFMRRIEMLRDAKNQPAGESRWLTWPRSLAVLLLIIGAAAIAGLRGTSPAIDVAQAQDKPKPKEETREPLPDTGEISLAYLPSDCVAFAAVRIPPLLNNPETAEVLRKLDLRTAESKAALPLERVSQLTMIVAVQAGERLQQSEPLILVEVSGPADFSKALMIEGGPTGGIEEVQEADLEKRADTPAFVCTRVGDKAAVFGRAADIARYLARKRGGPPLVRADSWKKVSSRPLVVAIDMMALRRIGLPADGPDKILGQAGLSPIWDETESIAIGVSLEKKAEVRVVAECLGEKGAAQLEETAAAGAIVLRNILRDVRSARLRQVADNLGARSIAEPDFVQLLYDSADKALSNVKVERQETLVTAQASVDLKGRFGALAAVLPTAEAMRANNRKVQAANNIRQIMLAMHNYADVHKHFPPAVIYGQDGKGKVPHSWRVELLPYLEGEALYKAYNFEEPWDSENNKKILAQMPAVFRDPGDDPKWVRSAYYVLVGKTPAEKEGAKPGRDEGGGAAAPPAGGPPTSASGPGAGPPPGVEAGTTVDTRLPTAFSKKEGIRFIEILDGTSNTIAVVEAKRDIPWTKPEDIPYDPEGKAPRLGGFYEGGFWAGICDGSVQFLPANISAESLRAYLSPAAGDQIAPQKPPLPGEARPAIETPRPASPK